MRLHRRSAQAYPEILLGSPAPSDGALFPQRPKLVCFKEVIFRSCCLAGGKTFFLNRRADCNRIPPFSECLLPFSTMYFPFFCVSQCPLHCHLPTHVCSSPLLFHFLYHCSCCARIWYKEVCREWGRDPASALRMLCFKDKAPRWVFTWAEWPLGSVCEDAEDHRAKPWPSALRTLHSSIIHGLCSCVVLCPLAWW